MITVVFLVKATGTKVTRQFESSYQARLFANKLKHSRKCSLISCTYGA